MPKAYVELPDVKGCVYKPFSKYPFVLRDIAVFVPNDISAEQVATCIHNEGGVFVRQCMLFDIYEKGDSISFAFRIAFQSDTETLTDDIVNTHMQAIEAAMEAAGWQVLLIGSFRRFLIPYQVLLGRGL